MQKFIRYAKYFLVPMKIAKDHKNYNKVLAWQQFYGLILAFYFRMFRVKNAPEIVVLTFIYSKRTLRDNKKKFSNMKEFLKNV